MAVNVDENGNLSGTSNEDWEAKRKALFEQFVGMGMGESARDAADRYIADQQAAEKREVEAAKKARYEKGQTAGGAAANYGGSPEKYREAITRQEGLAGLYQNMGLQAYGDAAQIRANQIEALNMTRDAALGRAPSIAALQQQQGLNQAMANQTSLAASARGAAGLASANREAAGNVANAQQQTTAAAAQMRAQEMLAARNAYSGQSSDLRGQDINLAGNVSQQGLTYEQLMHDLKKAQLNAQGGYAQTTTGLQIAQMQDATTRRGQDYSVVNAGIGAVGGSGSSAIGALGGGKK